MRLPFKRGHGENCYSQQLSVDDDDGPGGRSRKSISFALSFSLSKLKIYLSSSFFFFINGTHLRIFLFVYFYLYRLEGTSRVEKSACKNFNGSLSIYLLRYNDLGWYDDAIKTGDRMCYTRY